MFDLEVPTSVQLLHVLTSTDLADPEEDVASTMDRLASPRLSGIALPEMSLEAL